MRHSFEAFEKQWTGQQWPDITRSSEGEKESFSSKNAVHIRARHAPNTVSRPPKEPRNSNLRLGLVNYCHNTTFTSVQVSDSIDTIPFGGISGVAT